MTAPIADSVMAATYKLVQQAMTGQWQEVPKTIHERRDLLDKISSSARPQDQQWLSALRQAMTESDAAAARMAEAAAAPVDAVVPASVGPALAGHPATAENTDAVSTVLDLLGQSTDRSG